MNGDYGPGCARVPSPARMYDYYLGGKDNFAVDREAAEKALSVVPHGRHIARANRNFLVHAVRFMAERGVSQFIDVGAGIPTSPNVHETARAVDPHARVVCIDNDPVVMAHIRALVEKGNDGILALEADMQCPHNILANDALHQIVDFARPIGVLFVAVLHFISDEDDPRGSVGAFTRLMTSGSYLALSHITSDGTEPDVIATIHDAYRNATAPAVFRTADQIRQFFDGTNLIDPGLVDVSDWYAPGNIRPPGPRALRFLAGIATKA